MMTFKSLAAAAAIVALATPLAARAQTAPAAAPVVITSLTIQPAIVGTALNQSGSVNLSFVNTKATAATEVDFALIAHNEVVRTATLKGTFSKGITIKKAWTTTVTDVNQSAAITKVVFADGTTWAKPAVP